MIEIRSKDGEVLHSAEVDAYLDIDLSGAKLPRANLKGADLSQVTMSGADLTGADLTGANLQDTDLSGAILRDADLGGAYLAGTNLYRADLSGTNFLGANLESADIRIARYDGETRWPGGFDPKAHGAMRTQVRASKRSGCGSIVMASVGALLAMVAVWPPD